jgi:MoaA/NifB/PqqE/SkfB family radical SAM enzyme
MSIQDDIFERTFSGLFQMLISQRHLRKKILGAISNKIYQELVDNNPLNRPGRILKEQHAHIVALVNALDRGIEKGLLCRSVQDHIVRSFIQNVFLTNKREIASHSIGFEPPWFLLISPTGKCNLRCIGCYAASDPGNHSSLDFETFNRIITEKEELWGSYFTVISGGEPLLWRDGEMGLLDVVARHPSDTFMVYTNATFISEDIAKRMAELGNISPAISLEGFEEETDARRGKGVYKRILTAFENLRKYGVPYGISITPTKHNWELATSDRFVNFYFEVQGALYGWLFQYMPIGRKPSLELMIPPEQRMEMIHRTNRIVHERKILFADFWNSGHVSDGCISAGRTGGYYHIDWNGDIMPCAFVPFAADNIYRIYKEGGTINTVLNHPLFKGIREWQDNYGFAQSAERIDNWLCPCVIRDHFDVIREIVDQSGATPINKEAAFAIQDKAYCEAMTHYGKEIKKLTDPIWLEEYINSPELADLQSGKNG